LAPGKKNGPNPGQKGGGQAKFKGAPVSDQDIMASFGKGKGGHLL